MTNFSNLLSENATMYTDRLDKDYECHSIIMNYMNGLLLSKCFSCLTIHIVDLNRKLAGRCENESSSWIVQLRELHVSNHSSRFLGIQFMNCALVLMADKLNYRCDYGIDEKFLRSSDVDIS